MSNTYERRVNLVTLPWMQGLMSRFSAWKKTLTTWWSASAKTTELSPLAPSDSLNEEESLAIIEQIERTRQQVRTGGKLYLAGEYAILTAGQTAVIQFIPLYLEASIAPAEDYRLSSDMFDYAVGLEADANYALIQETVELMNSYLQAQGRQLEPFSLEITGKLERDGIKLGIGSSGSVTLLTIKAMAAFYQIELSLELLFKLAAAVLLKRGDNGSMGDLACIAAESLIAYRSFDRAEIGRRLADEPLLDVLAADWGFDIRPIEPNLSAQFLVGWTGKAAISKHMVNTVQKHITPEFLTAMNQASLDLESGLLAGDSSRITAALKAASDLLEELSPQIYTEELRSLKIAAQGLAGVAKSSGAGGGDCGVALTFGEASSQLLQKRWAAKGIVTLYQEEWKQADEES